MIIIILIPGGGPHGDSVSGVGGAERSNARLSCRITAPALLQKWQLPSNAHASG